LKILSFTGSRAEYYILRPLFRKLSALENVEFRLIVSGGIIKEQENKTLNDIKADNINILRTINIPPIYSNHSESIGYLCLKLTPVISEFNPDICIVYADRFESFAFAIASMHANKILLHIEAGDITEGGTYDDQIRHCISKMSHLFCTSTENGISIVRNLGEENWRIIHSGLLSYDDMALINNVDKENLKKQLNMDDNLPIIIATMHPLTLSVKKTKIESKAFFEALYDLSIQVSAHFIVTSPNSDRGHEFIKKEIDKLISSNKNILFIDSLGGYRYQTLMSLSSERTVIVCGNSSSIIKEAPFYNAFSLNVGSRQKGRESASTQINCKADKSLISKKLKELLNLKKFNCSNPYFVEDSSTKVINFIFQILKSYSKEEILNKRWNFNNH